VALLAVGCAEPAGSAKQESLTTSTCVTFQRGHGGDLVTDAYIKPNALNKNFGDKQLLRVSSSDEALLRFELSRIPSSATVTRATLKLFANGEAGDGTLQFHRITAPWTESEVNYASFKQAFAPELIAALRVESTTAQKSIDVTSVVSGWVGGSIANHGLELEVGPDHHPGRQHDADDDGNPTLFVSSEGQQPRRPALEVCYSVFSDECADSPCRNGGTCTNGSQGFSCACAPGFAGPRCEEVRDRCAVNPCQHGGACANEADGYLCVCPAGFSGANCETDIDDCAGQPCQNGGVCSDGVASFSCACAPGYDGANCEHLIDNCESTPCHNGGACASDLSGFNCACAPGFSGATCDTNIDDCSPNPCVNGTCVDGVGSYSCSCGPDWGGPRCDVNLNSCAQSPCLNGGSCTNSPGTYSCACPAGYVGANCEIDSNDCAPNPCQNGGVCVDGVASHSCLCPAGWEGAACQDAVVVPLRVRIDGTCYDICTTSIDPEHDGWGYERGASCIMESHPLAKTSPWCDTPVPPEPYEAPNAAVGDDTISVATIPRPAHVEVAPPSNCPYDAPDLVPLDPAWLSQDGMLHIPENTRVLVNGNDEIPADTWIRQLHIPESSELVFADVPGTFRVTDIMVDGALRLGSPTCRLENAIVFEFDTEESMPASKPAIIGRMGLGIMVSETGVLDLFGHLHQPTWTRLAATAAAGASVLSLAEPVDWLPGQQLVVATSQRLDYPYMDQNEVRTISSVDGASVTLDRPLLYKHYGGPEYQIEVGLLSHNLQFRSSEHLAAVAPGFGGHIMVHSKHARVSGVELYGMGQQNVLARYPFHFHRAGDVAGAAYFTDSSVWRSNFRCAVIHRTDRAIVSRNVAYDNFGHCYYLEDGVEMNNELSFNLAVRTKVLGPTTTAVLDDMRFDPQTGFTQVESADLIQPADRAAAGFYISNGNNRIIGNASSGGFAGFSLPNLPQALGGSPERIFPINYGASHFDGNTAHSSGYFWKEGGACIYVGGTLSLNQQGLLQYVSGRDQSNPRLRKEVFNNTKTFLCESGMVHWGNRPRVVNFESWNNGLLAKLFGTASIQSTLVVPETGNTLTPFLLQPWFDLSRPLSGAQRGFQFYDTWTQTILNDVVFRNFHHAPDLSATALKEDDNCALYSMTHSDEWTPQQMNTVAGLHFPDVDDAVRLCVSDRGTLSSRNFNVVDQDGSLSGAVGDGLPTPRLVASGYTDAWRVSNECVKHEPWGAIVCPLRAPQSVASIATTPNANVRVTMYGLDNTTLGSNWFSSTEFSNSQMTGPSGVGWHYAFPAGVPNNIDVYTLRVPVGSFVLMSFTLPPGIRCSVAGPGWSESASLSALLAAPGAAYITAQNTCFVRVPPTDNGAFEASGLSVPNLVWRGFSATATFTLKTGCISNPAACLSVASKLPTL
jgi:hypothetical protein